MKKLIRRNGCIECGCSCICINVCKGDVKKCTSIKAKIKKCPHCCDCYIHAFCEEEIKKHK